MLGEYGIVLVKATQGAAKASEGTVTKFTAKPVLLEESGGSVSRTDMTKDLTVLNVGNIEIKSDDYLIAMKTIQGFYVADKSTGAGSIVQFVATSSMDDKAIEASIVGGGGTITVLDPQNMFGEAEIGSVGRAYLTPTGDYVILTCSCPVNLARVKITSDLLKTDISVTGRIENVTDDWILSSYPAVDMPPEFTEAEFGNSEDGFTDGFEVEIQNTHNLDAVRDSYVRIKRRTNLEVSKTGNSATEAFVWEIVAVEKPIARWVRFAKSASGSVQNGLYWDGYEPDDTDITWLIADPGCMSNGDMIIACYRPEEHDYIPVSTQSALLGNPDDVSVVTAVSVSSCGGSTITNQPTKTFKCGQEPTTSGSGSSSQTIQVVTGITLADGALCGNLYEVDVCFAAPAGTVCIPVVECESPPPPPSLCGGSVDWIFTEGGWQWFSGACAGDCYAVPPEVTGGETEGDMASTPCIDDTPDPS